MTITFATIVSRGYCFLSEFRSGRCRSCLFAIYGASSVLLNGAALGALISITYAWSVKDEELSSSPPPGARTHGLPMIADWKCPEACCFPSTQCAFAVESGIFRLCSSPVETCLGMFDSVSLISGYWAICWRRWTERVRTVSPSRLTSVPASVFCLVVGVGFCWWLVFSCFVSSCVVVSLFSLCTIRSVIHKL